MVKRNGIRTNYVGNRLLSGELKCVIISNVKCDVPYWIRDLKLAPEWGDVDALKRGKIDFEEFKSRYITKKLNKLNPEDVYRKYEGYYLLCCEKDETFCHRTILADWLKDAGFDAEEGVF